MRRFPLFVCAIAVAVTALIGAAPKTIAFYLEDPGHRNSARFESRALLETVVGTTSDVTGTIEVNPDDMAAAPKVIIVVQLDGLKTGIDKRDEVMKSGYLEVDKYLHATFTLIRVLKTDSKSLADQKPVKMTARGTMEIHGVKKEVTADVTVVYVKESDATQGMGPGDLLRVSTDFNLKLSDFGIERPQFLLLRLADDIKISVDATATSVRREPRPPKPAHAQ